MKKTLLIVILILTSISNAQETGVKFFDISLKEAITKAKEENKIVMIEFWAPSACRVLI